MDHRFHNIANAIDDTCNWFLDHDRYQSWKKDVLLSMSERLLWLRGKPGSGKSTLMKKACSDLASVPIAHGYQHHRQICLIRFFFSARGGELDSNVEGFLRSSLVQIFESLHLKLDEEPLQSLVRKSILYENQDWKWALGELQALFALGLSYSNPEYILLLDALDECDPSTNRELVDFLRDQLERNPRFKVCISSRHYPNIFTSDCHTIVAEKYNEQDILSYATQKLRYIGGDSQLPRQISSQSSGIFLWAVLVISKLRQAIDDGESKAVARKLLNTVPQTLGHLFSEIMQSILVDPEKDSCLTLFLFVLCARRALNLKEMAIAMRLHAQNLRHKSSESDNICLDTEQLKKLIIKRSRGLIEVSGIEHSGGMVQFIHTSVKDFLLDNINVAFPFVSNKQEILTLGHRQLAKSCFTFLTTYDSSCKMGGYDIYYQDMKGNIRLHVFEHYTYLFAFYHASQCGIDDETVALVMEGLRSHFVHSIGNETSLILLDEYAKSYNCRHWIDMLRVCHEKAIFVLEAIPKPAGESTIEWLGLNEALAVAIFREHEVMIDILVSTGASLGTVKQDILHKAVTSGQLHVLLRLLEMGANISEKGQYGTIIHFATAIGNEYMVEALLNHGVAPAEFSESCWCYDLYTNPLLIATSEGHMDVVKLLLDRGFSITGESRYIYGYSGSRCTHPLEEACYLGLVSILQILLQVADRERIAKRYYLDAFVAAASMHRKDCVKLIEMAARQREFQTLVVEAQKWIQLHSTGSTQEIVVPTNKITIRVNTLLWGTIDLKVYAGWEGGKVKHLVAYRLGVPAERYAILIPDTWRRLGDNQRLHDVGIFDGSTLYHTLNFKARTYGPEDEL